VISSITKELELKETRHELETHRQEHSDQQQVTVISVKTTFFVSQHFFFTNPVVCMCNPLVTLCQPIEHMNITISAGLVTSKSNALQLLVTFSKK